MKIYGKIYLDTLKLNPVGFASPSTLLTLGAEPSLLLTPVPQAFIRGLLENVGSDINPIRLIRRIKNGLEIPGLKDALIKILHDFNLQISLMEGCQAILNGDSTDFSRRLQKDQTKGFYGSGGFLFRVCYCLALVRVLKEWFEFLAIAATRCPVCSLSLLQDPNTVALLFLCRHVLHLHCVRGGENIPYYSDLGKNRGVSGKIA